MEELLLKDLDPRLQKQIENARAAIVKNPGYAIDILTSVLKKYPGAIEVRQFLRQAQQRGAGGKSSGLGGIFSKVSGLLGGGGSKKDPAEALNSAEDQLNANPNNAGAHRQLVKAAEQLGLTKTAILGYESLRKLEPKNSANTRALMSAYIKGGEFDKAVEVGEAAYRADPSDDEIQSLIKKASVQQTMDKGRWEEDKSFRDKLKDETEAQKLEQAGRAKTGDAGLRALIEDAISSVAEDPGNMNYYRDIAANFRKLGDFDSALEWVAKARELEAGRADVSLERLVGTLTREKMQKSMKETEEQIAADPKNSELMEKLVSLQQEERAFRLQQSEELVQRYPNEYSYRFELGELYLENGETDKAIKELQMALRSPKVRIDALILLGRAYIEKGFYDLATEQLETAKSEITGMTDQKKDVLYTLGTAYENQGEMEKAIAEYKILYGADISYKDVSDKIDAFYSSKSKSE